MYNVQYIPKNVNHIKIKTQVEELWHFNKKTIVSGIDQHLEAEIKEDIKHSTHSFLNSSKHVCGSRINQNFHRTLNNLKKYCEYYEKLDSIVFDKTKFEEITISPNKDHPVIRNENHIKYVMKKHLRHKISKQEYEFLTPCGSQPGKLYGLGKVHKKDIPFRPVVSMLNIAEYKIAKYLDSIIKNISHLNLW